MRGMILDLDDTLYRRADFLRSGFEAVAQYVAHSWRLDRDAVLFTLSVAHSTGLRGREFQYLCQEHRLPLSVIPTLVDVFRAHQPSLALDNDVRRALRTLRRDAWKLAILTNGDPGVQRKKVAALDLDPLVDHVLYAEEHAPGGKPNPACFQAAMNRLQLPASRCVAVGDDPVRDIGGAAALGLRTIQVLAPGTTGRVEADAVVTAFADVPRRARLLVSEPADAA
jgi:putative hydrolase of the HAD superfamily